MAKKRAIPTSHMISEIASRHAEILPKKIVKDVISKFLSSIEEHVVSGHKLRLNRVGIIQVKNRAARLGRNPQTGEEIRIPASKKVAFKPAKSLKELVIDQES